MARGPWYRSTATKSPFISPAWNAARKSSWSSKTLARRGDHAVIGLDCRGLHHGRTEVSGKGFQSAVDVERIFGTPQDPGVKADSVPAANHGLADSFGSSV